jgi:rare lipoprotein A (peptidoglycan hydrolase)
MHDHIDLTTFVSHSEVFLLLINPTTARIAAGAFAWGAGVLAIMTYQDDRQDAVTIDSVRNETIVLRQQVYAGTKQVTASNTQDGDEEDVAASSYPRVVQTIRFVNPDAPHSMRSNGERDTKTGRAYAPTRNPTYHAEGIASWYGPDFHGRLTANGERYDMNSISAAHRTMPLPSYARVTNLDNGRSIIVRVNNRGPFVHNRIIDLSTGTAKVLDIYRKGSARVRVEFVGPAPAEGSDDQALLATLRTGVPAPAPADLMVASAKPFAADHTIKAR